MTTNVIIRNYLDKFTAGNKNIYKIIILWIGVKLYMLLFQELETEYYEMHFNTPLLLNK